MPLLITCFPECWSIPIIPLEKGFLKLLTSSETIKSPLRNLSSCNFYGWTKPSQKSLKKCWKGSTAVENNSTKFSVIVVKAYKVTSIDVSSKTWSKWPLKNKGKNYNNTSPKKITPPNKPWKNTFIKKNNSFPFTQSLSNISKYSILL